MDINSIHKKLTILVEKYIKAIIINYGKYIPQERLDALNTINYNQIIKIYDINTINGLASEDMIELPICVDKIFNLISKMPEYGINKKHKTYNDETIINNNNTFLNYIIHAFISGITTEKYYEDLLLHETAHFCGSGGEWALKEGFTELLTRKLAKKYGFKTNGCGYPKEVAIAIELENFFGEELINKLTFMNSVKEIKVFLIEHYGREQADLFDNILSTMQQEFNLKYAQHFSSFDGLIGIIKKTYYYRQIDYSKVYELLANYKSKNENNNVKK